MRKLIMLFAFVALIIVRANASDSCKILFNKQVIFNGAADQETAVALLKAKIFKPKDCIAISYKSETANKGWERTFYINDASEKSLKVITLNKQSGSVAVKASILNKMKEKKQPVFIYTTSLPTDKALAARVRVRRIFICKIEWN
ncbi:hypothetical protein [Segetibacter aerophilus]|uniref:Uncharacterized protein n=1 Tax=Segetibacter aerophilus TaxID=670293 RepID=A0A512BJ22_9BACT|nr:hypothetical protein [Segetibacter aerophilus]GEO11817.1 hypothetical protein SAE01_43130 [Segetibacter aerophilus]